LDQDQWAERCSQSPLYCEQEDTCPEINTGCSSVS
jgi:hypothetical protein